MLTESLSLVRLTWWSLAKKLEFDNHLQKCCWYLKHTCRSHSFYLPSFLERFLLVCFLRERYSTFKLQFCNNFPCNVNYMTKTTPWSMGFPGGTSGKESACQCRRLKRQGFDPWARKILWSRKRQPTPIFLPGKFHGQRSHGTA